MLFVIKVHITGYYSLVLQNSHENPTKHIEDMHRSLDLPVLSIAIRLSFVTKVTKEYVWRLVYWVGEKNSTQSGSQHMKLLVLSKFFFFLLTFCTRCYLQQNELSAAQTTEFNWLAGGETSHEGQLQLLVLCLSFCCGQFTNCLLSTIICRWNG